MLLSRDKILLYLVFVFFIILTLLLSDVPFFWDEVYYIKAAHFIFDSNFSSFIPELENDRGNFPLYGFYMALAWKLFGKTLLVSHLAMLPVVLATVWEYFCLAKKFISEKWIFFSLLLFVFEPTYLTQSILMGHDLFLVYFFLLALNALLSNHKIIYSVALSFLILHNIKGIPISFLLSLFYFYHAMAITNRKIIAADILIHLIPLLLLLGWMFFHYKITGWYILTPIHDHGTGLNLNMFGLKKILLGIWQVIDFGRIFLWSFILFGGIYLWKQISSLQSRTIYSLLIITTSFSLLFFAVLDIQLCHRYFMVDFLIASIAGCYALEHLHLRSLVKYILASFFLLGLATGNCWIYGGGFSNGWDSSLKSLPYFSLRNDLVNYVKDEKISPETIGTKMPLDADLKISDLAPENFHFTNADTASLQNFRYVLLSNISNEFTLHEKEAINSKWKLAKEFRRGQVYLKLFKNPLEK